MSEDKTKDIKEKYKTEPTIETILRELREFRTEVSIRLDRIESMGNQTRAEMLALRADFTELRAQVRESLPVISK